MTNEDRAKTVAIALQAFAKSTGLSEENDGPETIVGDFIANALHWVVSREHSGGHGGALYAVRNGLGHFISEAYAEKDADETFGPDCHVSIYIGCEGDEWVTMTGEELPTMPLSFGGQ